MNKEVAKVFQSYPKEFRAPLKRLRQLILEVGNSIPDGGKIEETLKWGEPSYLCKTGSTVRIHWKEKLPEVYAMYFKCTADLIPAFRFKFKSTFSYEGKRGLVFSLEDEVPEEELRLCIAMALGYHKIKHLSRKRRWEIVSGW